MSANAEVLGRSGLTGSPAGESPRTGVFSEVPHWSPEDFACEQIRGLVRRVFLVSGAPPPRQVAFSAMDAETDASHVCDQVGRALALETNADIAIVGGERSLADRLRPHPRFGGRITVKSWSIQKTKNLWHVPKRGGRGCGTGRYWLSFLADLRNEFEYVLIQAPAAGTSSETTLLGQLSDGIILVLGAHSTRKATARKIKETLVAGQCRILGTVLSERTFPVPEWIYRRL